MSFDEIRLDCDGTPIVVGSLVSHAEDDALTGKVVDVGEWDADYDDDTGRGYPIAPYFTVIWDALDGSQTRYRYRSTQIGGWSSGPESELLPECECEELRVIGHITASTEVPS